MIRPLSSKLPWLLLAAEGLCAGQSERAAAMQWADYYAAVYRVPPELVHAIIDVESAWQPLAVSNKGAAGLMQLMPATAVNYGVTNRFVIQQNIRGGVAYLASLLRRFNGDLRLVTAAYVAGEERILPAGLRYSNAEVFAYVSKVARLYRRYREKHTQVAPTAQHTLRGGNSP